MIRRTCDCGREFVTVPGPAGDSRCVDCPLRTDRRQLEFGVVDPHLDELGNDGHFENVIFTRDANAGTEARGNRVASGALLGFSGSETTQDNPAER